MRPIRSPTLLLIRMNAADTSASSAIADWTPLTVVSRSSTTAEIETFISDVSTTSTNIAAASRNGSSGLAVSPGTLLVAAAVTAEPLPGLRGSRSERSSDASSSSLPAAGTGESPESRRGARRRERRTLYCRRRAGTRRQRRQ